MIVAVIRSKDQPNITNPNPYRPPAEASSPASQDHRPLDDAKRIKFFELALIVSGILLSLPPLPLLFWVADGEPFFGPARSKDLLLIGFSSLIGISWVFWAGTVALGVIRKKIGMRWLLSTLYAAIAGGIAFLVVFLYGCDQKWFV